MLAKVLAPLMVGMEGVAIEVECDITNGLPCLVVVGLGNQAVSEARDRVRGAIRNSKLVLPPKRITLNLAPADLPKTGTAFDLSMAIAILVASGQIEEATDYLFAGELSLDGSLKPVSGVLAYAQLAASQNISRMIVPQANAQEAALIEGVCVHGAHSLIEVYAHLAGLQPLETAQPPTIIPSLAASKDKPDLELIYGQAEAKRALEVAAAGGHNILLRGPPGSGKTMLARALVSILPPPSVDEIVEVSKIYSLAGKGPGGIIRERPFRNPHHSASDIALIGGGRIPHPGEISLSHRGVLFLDELPEFRREALEVLRQPLEDGTITVARAYGVVTFPAEFILIAAQNPCPCGYAGDALKPCICMPAAVTRYTNKLSGPLLDRIDIVVDVNRVDLAKLNTRKEEPSKIVAGRVGAARHYASELFGRTELNARLPDHAIKDVCRMDAPATATIQQAARSIGLSARGFMRTLKVARTLADLDSRPVIEEHHIAEAIRYRPTA